MLTTVCEPSSTRFSIIVEADQALLKMLPHHWEDFFGKAVSANEKHILRLKEDSTLSVRQCSPGWSVKAIDGCKIAFYAPHGIPHYSVIYDQNMDNVIICTSVPYQGFVQTSLLYGMLIALHQICVGLHGVTVRLGNQTVILSAPSGTGKTTLSQLLAEHCGAQVINGDFAMLSHDRDIVMFEPTPYCGTSHVCLNERTSVDRIVFLTQSKENKWHDMEVRESMRNLCSNSFVPTFDGQLARIVQMNIARMIPSVKISGYAFTPTKKSAELFLKRIT